MLFRSKAEYLIEETKEKRKGKKRKEAQETQASPDLVELLRRWRAAKAKEENVKAFQILHQKALLAIAAAKPRDPKELANLYGIGDKTVEKYGKELLDLVADFRESGQ